MSLFCDHTQIKLKGGNGGNGCVSFRREKFEPKGGPDGGDGGNGGSIFLKVNHALNSLTHLHRERQFQAKHGEKGTGQRCHGKNGDDLTLEVPLGTIVREIKDGQTLEIADLSQKDQIIKVTRGGKGGYGNAHFVSSIRQAPAFAELGEDGEELEIELELKLVADIGIIGFPNAGKSSLISVISNAKPKIAAYPFTTLIPHLGVVKIDEKVTYIVADIPGLIEGAHTGKGLGIEFLKHIQRCRLLVHMIDPSQETGDPVKNFELINEELSKFSKDLAEKNQIVIVNKSDLLSEEAAKQLLKTLKKNIGKKKRFLLSPEAISCATTKGVKELKIFLYQQLQLLPKPDWQVDGRSENTERIIYRPHLSNPKYFSVSKREPKVFQVLGKRIEQIINMTDSRNEEALNRAYDVLKRMGILRELKKIGAKDGDRVMVGKKEIEFREMGF